MTLAEKLQEVGIYDPLPAGQRRKGFFDEKLRGFGCFEYRQHAPYSWRARWVQHPNLRKYRSFKANSKSLTALPSGERVIDAYVLWLLGQCHSFPDGQ